MALFGAAGCKNSETPAAKCECPDGTIHEAGEACCDGVDCACKEVKYYEVTFQDKKIPVEDRSGEKVTQKELDLIQSTLTYLATNLSEVELPKAKKHLSKIIISDYSDRNGGTIYLDFDSLVANPSGNVGSLIQKIIAITSDDSLTFNNFNSTIRLANASAGVPGTFLSLATVVFPSPGLSSIRTWPSARIAAVRNSRNSRFPRMIREAPPAGWKS
jgi:hypothetical protein